MPPKKSVEPPQKKVGFSGARSESGNQYPLGKNAGYSSIEPPNNKYLRQVNSQTREEEQNARREVHFNGIDPETNQAMFCDNLGMCFLIGAAALAAALAASKFSGGKIQKTKRRKNKNIKTKRRR